MESAVVGVKLGWSFRIYAAGFILFLQHDIQHGLIEKLLQYTFFLCYTIYYENTHAW